ncbi:hypothetical protein C8F01DRAFT_1082874 [Mycena amicta]|nr:hypothetical protein C8F01DRAFT_1082874 [Mycena amicta]
MAQPRLSQSRSSQAVCYWLGSACDVIGLEPSEAEPKPATASRRQHYLTADSENRLILSSRNFVERPGSTKINFKTWVARVSSRAFLDYLVVWWVACKRLGTPSIGKGFGAATQAWWSALNPSWRRNRTSRGT